MTELGQQAEGKRLACKDQISTLQHDFSKLMQFRESSSAGRQSKRLNVRLA